MPRCVSIRLVWISVTFVYRVKTAKHRPILKHFSLSRNPTILLFLRIITTKFPRMQNAGGYEKIAIFDQHITLSGKRTIQDRATVTLERQ